MKNGNNMTAREFLIEYFKIEPEYTNEDSIGNFYAVDLYIANSLYDDIAAGNIQELLEIMESYAQEYSNSSGRRMEE